MNKEGIKKIIQEIIDKLTLEMEEINIIEDENGIVFMTQIKEASFLIGHNGVNLTALNHIIKRIIDKQKLSEEEKFTIDINGYQMQKNKELIGSVKILSNKVKSLKSDIEMNPMSAYERMLVHSTLTSDPKVFTESFGQGRERRVVIKYKK